MNVDSKPIVTDIRGKSIDKHQGGNVFSHVGKLISNYHLDSVDFEIVDMVFNDDYHGVPITMSHGGNILTIAKNINNDRDIISPLVTINSGYNYPIHSLISGTIACIKKPIDKKSRLVQQENCCTISVIVPGATIDQLSEWSLVIPQNMKLDRKIIYIKKFNIYIGGGVVDTFITLNKCCQAVPLGNRRENEALVKIEASGDTSVFSDIQVAFGGIQTEIPIMPTSSSVITVSVSIDGTRFEETFTARELASSDKVICRHWQSFGGVDVFIDTNVDRLRRFVDNYRDLNNSIRDSDVYLVEELRIKLKEAQTKITTLNETIDDYRNKLRTMEIDYDLKIEQEQHKTERERIKLDGSKADHKFNTAMEVFKLAGGILGCASLVAHFVIKNNIRQAAQSATTKSSMVEWASVGVMNNLRNISKIPVSPEISLALIGIGILIVGGSYLFLPNKE